MTPIILDVITWAVIAAAVLYKHRTLQRLHDTIVYQRGVIAQQNTELARLRKPANQLAPRP